VSDCPLTIAVLDDEAHMRKALRRLLGSHGHSVTVFEDGRNFLKVRADHHFDCLVLDLHMPSMNGFEVLETLSRAGGSPPVIVITGQDQCGNEERVSALGAEAYLVKPIDEEPLLQAIDRCAGRTTRGAQHPH
jgi:CheY-like chemotaxis protein